MRDKELLKDADFVISGARERVNNYIRLAKIYSKAVDRTSTQSILYVNQGMGTVGGLLVPIKVVKDTLFIDNYEMHYIESLIQLTKNFLNAGSGMARKLALRPIIESIYHYAEASILPIEGKNAKRLIRFRYLQTLFFSLHMARKVGGIWVKEYISFLQVASKKLPKDKLRLFPKTTDDIKDIGKFKDRDILKCIELVAQKVGSKIVEPAWFHIIFDDISLLAHGNPFGVSVFGVRDKQRREECLNLSIMLSSLAEVAEIMAKTKEISPDLKSKLLDFSKSSKEYCGGEMKKVWLELSKKQI